MKRLIVTGDDFGLAPPVNEAIVEAHRRGILTTASLMVGAGAAGDAVEKARSLPSLRVGLHLVVVEGRPVLPREAVPDLVETNGEFSDHPARSGMKYLLRPNVKRQLEDEIRAQFEAFHRTGLELDHVNTHNHMHLHPVVLTLMLKVGRSFGMRAVRFPYEPPLPSWRASRKSLPAKLAWCIFLSPWMQLLRSRLRKEGFRTNDFVFGMTDSGAMNTNLVLALLRELPEGITEMYFHPATRRCPEIDRTMAQYLHEEEYKALTSPLVWEALERNRIERVAFSTI